MKGGSDQILTSPPSITGRLLRGLIGPLAIVALLLGASGVWAVQEAVEAVNDRILGASARAIAESLTVENREITLDLPPSAFGMLENNARDNVYYNVIHEGRVITGYADLPNAATPGLKDGEAAFSKADYRGQQVRIVSEARRLPRIGGLVIVQVAESMKARQRLLRPVLIALALIEGVLILVGIILVPFAVRWGLRPLARLRAEMDRRRASEFTPLSLQNVPTELNDLVRAFNTLLTRLEDAVEGVRRFTADASHQMRTPLSILRTHIAVLRQAPPGCKEVQQSIDDIDQASARLQHLLVQLLALARAESAEPHSLALEIVDLNDLARSVAAELAPQAMKAKIGLAFEVSPTPAQAKAHPVLAAELLTNLIDNAIRYNRPKGLVEVRVENTDKTVRIVVEDDGPGIAAEDRERVFTRFTRLGGNHNRSGSGLGLSIATALAAAMNATICLADGRNGQGLRVSIDFIRTG